MKDLSKTLEIKRTLSTVYYFQTNSQTERINQCYDSRLIE